MNKGDLNKFYLAPTKEKANSIRTEIDQNKYWMYFVRRGIDWLKKEKGYRNIDQICAESVRRRNTVGYTSPSSNFILKTMRNDADNLVSELSVLNFFTLMGAPCVEIGAEAMKDYIEEAIIKYNLVLENYQPRRPIEPMWRVWIKQVGSTPFTKKGKVKYGYYNSPFRTKNRV